MGETRRKTTITVLNHLALGTAPPGYVLFEIHQGDASRPRSEWPWVITEKNPHTAGEYRHPTQSAVELSPDIVRAMDAIDRALAELAAEKS